MNFISKLFKKNVSEAEEAGKGSVEEFVSLIRVYYQAVMAVNLGITNLNMLADMALFKRMLKIPTQNNKLGVAEKSRVRKVDGGLRPKRGFLQGDRQLGEEELQEPERYQDVFLHVPRFLQ